ncbi:MAG TPA: hypothetical protein VLQ90_02825 [Pyrinomonadaceae bacterium]|nr:hypothetical protein [Pyrinomonadaceae bacterium]
MDETTKVTIDTLYKEFQRVQAKSLATDDWFFRYVQIGITPFFLFIAFCLAKPEYTFFVIALPWVSAFGSMVIIILSTHYRWAACFSKYLQERINSLLRSEVLVDHRFGQTFYTHWDSPVALSYVVGFGALLLVNLLPIPLINSQLAQIHVPKAYEQYDPVRSYWLFTLLFIGFVMVGVAFSIWRSRVHAARLLADLRHLLAPRSESGDDPVNVAAPS